VLDLKRVVLYLTYQEKPAFVSLRFATYKRGTPKEAMRHVARSVEVRTSKRAPIASPRASSFSLETC